MGNTILINPYRFPPPFEAPEIDWLGSDVGVTNAANANSGSSLTLPTNRINQGDQILVAICYFWGAAHALTKFRVSDNVDGTVGWANTFYSGDAGSDMWADFHFKTATGGETDITYVTPGQTDYVAYVIRFGPDDHIEFTASAEPAAAGSFGTLLSDVESVSAPVDASYGWFLALQRDEGAGLSLSNPGNYTLAKNENAGVNQSAAFGLFEQNLAYEASTLTTDVSWTDTALRRAQQITVSRKSTWSTPVIEGHTFLGPATISPTVPMYPSNPSGMQVGDLLLFQYIANDDGTTNPIINGFTIDQEDCPFNQIANHASNAGQDWRNTVGWRIWDGTEPTWEFTISYTFGRTAEIIMYRVSGVNQAEPILSEWFSSYGNTAPNTYTINTMNCAPNSLAVIGLVTWGAVGTTTQDPGQVGLVEYSSPTTKTRIWTGPNLGQDPQPYGVLEWDSANPERGRFGFTITGLGEQPAPVEFPLIENFQSVDQEVTDWENGETWNNFWGWGWKPDGTKFVTVNNSNDRIYGFDFATPFDFNTTSNNSANPGQSVQVVGLDVMFNEDGTKYSTWSWFSNQTLRTYNAGTAYEPSTSDTLIGQIDLGSYASNSMESYWIDRSGKHLIIGTAGNATDKLLHFMMDTPWDPSTIVLQPDEYDLDADGILAAGRIFMSPTGRDLFMSSPNDDSGIRHYKLAFPYNLDTMGEVSRLADDFFARGGGIWMTDDGTKLITGPGANDPYDIQIRTITADPATTPPQAASLNIWLDAGEPSSYNGTGDTWYDLSPSRNHATWLRGQTDCENIHTSGTNGYFDLDLSSNSTNRVFSIADHVSIRPDGADPWTVSYLTAPSDVSTVSQDYLGAKTNQFSMLYQYYSAGRYAPFLNASASWNDTFDEYFADEVDGWYLITMRSTGAGGIIDGNVNGNWNTDAGNAAQSITSTVGTNWHIGGTNTSTATLFPGRVAGVWFWQGVALSDVDVAQHVSNIGARWTLSTSFKP